VIASRLQRAIVAIVCATLATHSWAQVPASQPTEPGAPAAAGPTIRGDEITLQQQEAVTRGLAWLATRQGADGSFGPGPASAKNAAITSLAAIAYMQGGSLPGRGPYGEQVSKAVDFILSCSQSSGLLVSDPSGGPMYGHGFATLFLAEVYGMTGDARVREPLQRAVRLIQLSQNPEGGWRYQPVPMDADISVTICQVMALRAARDAGIKIDPQVITNAIAYVQRCQNPDGGFNYMAGMGGQSSGFARSAAGVASLYYAGQQDSKTIRDGLAYLRRFPPGVANPVGEGHYYYGRYYAVQAMYLAGGDNWRRFYPAVRDELIARQSMPSGNWDGDHSAEYATAMALIILQMPNGYLPVYSGKGPGS